MRLKKLFADRKREMLPQRYRLNYCVLPLFLLLGIAAVVSTVVFERLENTLGTVLGLAFFVLLGVCVAFFSVRVRRLEIERALKEFSYFFEKGEGIAEAHGEDVELGVKFLLKKEGVQITYPIQG